MTYPGAITNPDPWLKNPGMQPRPSTSTLDASACLPMASIPAGGSPSTGSAGVGGTPPDNRLGPRPAATPFEKVNRSRGVGQAPAPDPNVTLAGRGLPRRGDGARARG